MQTERWLVAGLGNPGPRYHGSRHNVGFMVANAICARERLRWRDSPRFSGQVVEGPIARRAAVLVKPQTFMNRSGQSVGPLARFHDVPVEQIIVIHDDVDLEPGRLKIKAGGGDGGHRGIRSMSQELGSPDFVRIRFGIGRPTQGEVTDFVLEDFCQEELEPLASQIDRAVIAVNTLITRGVREAMNRHNRPPRKEMKDSEQI